MASKPLIIAESEQDRYEERTFGGDDVYWTPAVKVVVEFRLGEHEEALRDLETHYLAVKRQIKESTHEQ